MFLELISVFVMLFSMMSLLFTYSFHPYHMVMSLVFLSFIISLMVFKGFGSAWFSYVFILLFVGGLMVVFVYICTLVPNEWFYFSYGLFIALSFFSSLFYFMDYSPYLGYSKLSGFYNMSFYYLISLGCVLYFSLLTVVKLVYSPKGGLKSYF